MKDDVMDRPVIQNRPVLNMNDIDRGPEGQSMFFSVLYALVMHMRIGAVLAVRN